MARYDDDSKSYLFEATDMRILDRLRVRLYDDKPISDDQRRDLANTLDALMYRAGSIDLKET